MSTRCNIVVKDKYHSIQLYRHCDGYPDSEHGVVENLKQALPLSWELPRMEASDFAAAIVAAWKEHGGNIYIDGDYRQGETLHGDIEYVYFIEPDEKAGKWSLTVKEMNWGKAPDYIATIGKTLFKGHGGDDYPE